MSRSSIVVGSSRSQKRAPLPTREDFPQLARLGPRLFQALDAREVHRGRTYQYLNFVDSSIEGSSLRRGRWRVGTRSTRSPVSLPRHSQSSSPVHSKSTAQTPTEFQPSLDAESSSWLLRRRRARRTPCGSSCGRDRFPRERKNAHARETAKTIGTTRF